MSRTTQEKTRETSCRGWSKLQPNGWVVSFASEWPLPSQVQIYLCGSFVQLETTNLTMQSSAEGIVFKRRRCKSSRMNRKRSSVSQTSFLGEETVICEKFEHAPRNHTLFLEVRGRFDYRPLPEKPFCFEALCQTGTCPRSVHNTLGTSDSP